MANAGNELPSSRELERLNEELRQLNGEKLKLEEEVNREEATMRLKQSEIKSMQNETETLHQMVRQLDVQKGEARKRLDDLSSQVCSLPLYRSLFISSLCVLLIFWPLIPSTPIFHGYYIL